jgi:hypothetical protein
MEGFPNIRRERIILPDRDVSPQEMPLVDEVMMCEGIISTANSSKPILATYGLAGCNSLAGYSAMLGRGFLTHVNYTYELIDNPDDKEGPLIFNKSLEFLGRWLSLGARGRIEYDIHIVTGHGSGTEEIEAYVREMNKVHGKSVRFNVVNIDHGEADEGNNIAIDLRTGKRLNYDSYNPNAIRYPDVERSLGARSLVWHVDDSLRKLNQ